jgi:NADPH:quinone reductase-like Zn-dependent oxidoreductase
MKAVFLEKQGGPLVVREVDTPVPGPGEVLIKIAAAPVNPSDLAGIRNAHDNFDLRTFIPGLEGSGKVVAIGKGLLPRLWKGKRVACSAKYHTSGTWAEYMATSAALCFPLNKKISDEQGSMSLVNPLTALAFHEIAKQNRHKAIINNAAASSLGRMVELLGDKYNVPVINIVRSESQSDLLKSVGSPYVLDSSAPEFLHNLRDLSLNLNATLLFDSVCGSQLGNIIEALPYGSSVMIYGNLSLAEAVKINPRSLIDNDIKISGFYLGSRSKKNGMIKNLLNLMEVSRLMSDDMKIKISNRFPLSKAQEAVDSYLGNMTAGKVLLVTG